MGGGIPVKKIEEAQSGYCSLTLTRSEVKPRLFGTFPNEQCVVPSPPPLHVRQGEKSGRWGGAAGLTDMFNGSIGWFRVVRVSFFFFSFLRCVAWHSRARDLSLRGLLAKLKVVVGPCDGAARHMLNT